jgi:hypothetical protein
MSVSGRHGRIALADFQLGEAVVVDTNGEWEGPWTRPGSGPGEVRAPLGVAWDTAGMLLVYDIGRHVLIRLAGPDSLSDESPVPTSFGGPVYQSGEFAWAATQGNGTLFLEPIPDVLEAGSRAEIRILRWVAGNLSADTVVMDTVPLVVGYGSALVLPGAPRPLLASTDDGRLALGGEDGHYRIRLIGPDGGLERTICRDLPSLPLTAQETGEQATQDTPDGPGTERSLAAIRAAPRPDPPGAMGRMFYDSDGRLWVQRERPSPNVAADRYFGVAGATWDLFDARGDWLGETIAPPAARIMAATGSAAYALEESADGALWLVALRLDLTPL